MASAESCGLQPIPGMGFCVASEAFDQLRHRTALLERHRPEHVPSFDHCVGTDRFLGTLFGTFLQDWLAGGGPASVLGFTKLYMALRAEVVLHDFLMDSVLSNADRVYVDELRGVFAAVARSEAASLLGDSRVFAQLLSTSREVVDRSYSELDASQAPSFRLILGKCDPMVGLALQVVAVRDSRFPLRLAQSIVERYFFALQCLDDWFDIEEDYRGRVNHNLLAWGLNEDEFFVLLERRFTMLPLVARYVAANLAQLESPAQQLGGKRSAFYRLLLASREFLGTWARLAGGELPTRLWNRRLDFTAYRPPHAVLGTGWENVARLPKVDSLPAWRSFRAETFHSLSRVVLMDGADQLS